MGWSTRKESYWEMMAREAAKITLPNGDRVTFEEYREWCKQQRCTRCGKARAGDPNGIWITETFCGGPHG